MIDSRLARFSQALQALILAAAFLLDARWAVPIMAVLLFLAVVGGPRWNLFAWLYKALPIPPGKPEPAAPPRFAQALGVVFLGIGATALLTAGRDTTAYWVVGWGPALLVAVLAGLAATTAF